MFNRNMSRESLGELSLITDFSNESTSYYWGYDLQLSKFAKIDNPFDSECEDSECNEYLTNILALPRDMVMDYDDRYLYVASYANNRVVAFIRDSASACAAPSFALNASMVIRTFGGIRSSWLRM